ncbi:MULTISPECIES: hypothetical protein [unclassified Thiocapsa]|uniref:hypothetical protein n=1 Tax=unclassified Thiocapsa TaxID=2641286 RepID=UPI0035B47063
MRREQIRDAVCFTLPGCPNALAWTVTAEPDGVLMHRAINRTEHDPNFIASIETFVEDWRAGLERPNVPTVETLQRPKSASSRDRQPTTRTPLRT